MNNPASIREADESRYYVFNGYRLFVARPALFRGDMQLPLPVKALEFLITLVETPDRAVGVDALSRRLWPASNSSAAHAGTLRALASRLRKSLGDDRHLVLTVAGFGYRFAGQAALQSGRAMANVQADNAVARGRPLEPALRQSRVPLPPSPQLIGRVAESSQLLAALSEHRCITISGMVGVGKTAMATAAARASQTRFADGIGYVSLNDLTPADGIPGRIAMSLGLPAISRRPVLARLAAYLANRQVLLVLDACQNVHEAVAGTLEHLLAMAPRLVVISTSSEALGVGGEYVLRLMPLSTRREHAPGVTEEERAEFLREMARVPAVQFFARNICYNYRSLSERSLLTNDEFVAAAGPLTRSLNGNPLALQLAAKRIRTATSESLARAVDLYREELWQWMRKWSGAPYRRLAHDAVLQVCYMMLVSSMTAAQEWLLRRISAFAAPFSLEAIMRLVCVDRVSAARIGTDLNALSDSVLELVPPLLPDQLPRFVITPVLLRFVRFNLWNSADYDAATRAHARYLIGTLRDAHHEQAWLASQPQAAGPTHDTLVELRAALSWSVNNAPSIALELLELSMPRWQHQGLLDEYLRWIEDALEFPGAEDRTPRMIRLTALRASALASVGVNFPQSCEAWHQVLSLASEEGDMAHAAEASVGIALTELAQGRGRSALRNALQAASIALHEPTRINARRIAALVSNDRTFEDLAHAEWSDATVFEADRQARRMGLSLTTALMLLRAARLHFSGNREMAGEWLNAAHAEAREDGTVISECMVLSIHCATAVFDDDPARLLTLLPAFGRAAQIVGLRHWQRAYREYGRWADAFASTPDKRVRLLSEVGRRLRCRGAVLSDVVITMSFGPGAPAPLRKILCADLQTAVSRSEHNSDSLLVELIEGLLAKLSMRDSRVLPDDLVDEPVVGRGRQGLR